MIITIEYPAVPKGVNVRIDTVYDDEESTIERLKETIGEIGKLRGGLWGKFRKAISPDVISQITDKVTDAAITGIAAEASKVK